MSRFVSGHFFCMDVFNHAKKILYRAPEVKEAVPFLNFSDLDNTLAQLKNNVEEFQKLYTGATRLSLEKQQQLNTVLYQAERALLQEKGLPRRSW